MPQELSEASPLNLPASASGWQFPSPEFPDPVVPAAALRRAIQLPKPCVMTREKVFSSVTITRIEDFPGQRLVLAMIEEYHNPIVLWQADEYTAICNWTQQQAEQKLVNIIASINTF